MNDNPSPDLDALRTRVANQAASLAEAVTDGFADFHMGAGDYIVELSSPEGPSTQGGVQARQSLRLVPRRKGYAIVVAGTVDPVTSTAELRTFDHVAKLHELRFRSPLEITDEEYRAFLVKADIVLNLARIRAKHIPPSAQLEEQLRTARTSRRVSIPLMIVFAVILVLAAIVAFRVAVSLRG